MQVKNEFNLLLSWVMRISTMVTLKEKQVKTSLLILWLTFLASCILGYSNAFWLHHILMITYYITCKWQLLSIIFCGTIEINHYKLHPIPSRLREHSEGSIHLYKLFKINLTKNVEKKSCYWSLKYSFKCKTE